jgi:cytoskeletal protein CcmA (bactofilin family)
MFEKRENKVTNENVSSGSINLIGQGTTITGDLDCKGDIRIDGEIIGNLRSKAKVVIGSTGKVIGQVNASSLDLSGVLTGDVIVSETIFLKSTANLEGNMIANKLVVEAGAQFNGLCKMGVSAKPHVETMAKAIGNN